MNELARAKGRILGKIEMYIRDIEFAQERELTEDEKTIFASVKHIINEEFEKMPAPLPRFIIGEDGKIKQFKTSDEGERFTDAEAEKFKKFLDEYTGTCAEVKKRLYEETMKWTEAIFRLSNTCGVSYGVAKDIVLEIMETLKEPKTNTAKWVIAGIGVDCTGYRFKEYKCSKCGNIDLSHRKNKFCPECGRRMEG